MSKAKRGLIQGLKWWFNTRVKAWWTVFLPGVQERAKAQHGRFKFSKRAAPMADSTDQSVTAILTVYKRSQYLKMQIEALRAQTHPPKEIWIWSNDNDSDAEDFSAMADRVIVSNSNWKFWGRFALASMARTRYVALLDDDILPQPQWFQNCLNTITEGYDGILGGSGVVLPAEGGYSSKHKVGWNGHHYDYPAEVDLVGHAWFFNKSHLQFMWREEPASWENGEDIHFSAMALKHGDVHTWVPPHSENSPESWCCRPDFGKMAGRTSTATHKAEGHHQTRDLVVDQNRAQGWQICADRLETPGHAH